MIEKINELKTSSKSKEVTSLCETAMATISSAMYNGVTPEAKLEIERVVLTNLFEELAKQKDADVLEWTETQKRIYTLKNLGVREAVNALQNETPEIKDILDSFKELLNQGVHEALLYEQFTTALQSFSYFPEVGNAIKAVEDRVNNYKTDVDITKILEVMKTTRSNYLVPLIEDAVNNYLANKTEQTKSSLKETLVKFTYDQFVRDIVSLVTLDATDLQLEYANAECDIEKVYSPVLFLGENEAVFAVNKVYYVKKGNNVSRLHQVDVLKLDEEYKTLCETLSNHNVVVDKKGITVYFKNDKAFISESGVLVNDQEMNAQQFKDAVELSEMVGNKEFFMLVEFLRSNLNEIAEIDFVKRIYLKEDANYAADVFKLRDNVFITTHNPDMGKSTFYRNVNPIQAKNIMMEHMRFDVTSVFEGLLPDEEKIMAQINETKDAYNTYIADLQKKIDQFQRNPYGKNVNEQVVEALQEELQDVKNEFKDYLNHIEKYMRAPGLDEEITVDINVDGKKYTVPIPQEKTSDKNGEGDVEAGTEVGREDMELADSPASAVTFDDEDTELLGDTPSIPDDQVDLGVDGAEEDAEEAEEEAEEAEAEAEADDEEDELKQDTEEDGEEIKVEDEIDLEDFDKDGEGDKEEKETEEEKIEKKKKEKLESSEGGGGILKKKSFIKEADEEEPKKKKVYLIKKVTESKTELKVGDKVTPKDHPELASKIVDIGKDVASDPLYKLANGTSYTKNELKESVKKKFKKLNEQLSQEEIEGAERVGDGDAFTVRYRLQDGRFVDVGPDGNYHLVNLDQPQLQAVIELTPEESEGAEPIEGGDAFNNRYRLRDGRIVDMRPDGRASLVNESQSTWNGGIAGLTRQQAGAQIGDTVMYDKQKGYVIGAIGNDLIVQVQGNSHMVAPGEVKVLGAKVETIKPPFKFSKETQKLLFEQYVKCGIYMGNAAVKVNDCYVRFSDWQEAAPEQQVAMVVEGQQVILPKSQIRIFEDMNNFANLDNYVEGVIVDEATDQALENVRINVIDYTEAIGDADPVRIIRGGNDVEPSTDTVPKAALRTLSI